MAIRMITHWEIKMYLHGGGKASVLSNSFEDHIFSLLLVKTFILYCKCSDWQNMPIFGTVAADSEPAGRYHQILNMNMKLKGNIGANLYFTS